MGGEWGRVFLQPTEKKKREQKRRCWVARARQQSIDAERARIARLEGRARPKLLFAATNMALAASCARCAGSRPAARERVAAGPARGLRRGGLPEIVGRRVDAPGSCRRPRGPLPARVAHPSRPDDVRVGASASAPSLGRVAAGGVAVGVLVVAGALAASPASAAEIVPLSSAALDAVTAWMVRWWMPWVPDIASHGGVGVGGGAAGSRAEREGDGRKERSAARVAQRGLEG